MIIGSYNIRGGGSIIKHKRICSSINKGKADFFIIQETKMETMLDSMVNSMWDNGNFEYCFLPSVDRSGGLVLAWNYDSMKVLSSFYGTGFLETKVLWKDNIYYIANVYSCSGSLKRPLWKELLEWKQKGLDGVG